MSFGGAAAFLVYASLRNRLRRAVRQPRYLVFTLLGGTYLWAVLGRSAAWGQRSPSALATGVPPSLVALVLTYLASLWVLSGDRTALSFTEPEVLFFFTAPVSKRALIEHRLVRALLATAVGATLTALVMGRGAHFEYHVIGIWLGLATLSFHGICASLARATLAERGFRGLRRRLPALAVLVGIAGTAAYGGERAASWCLIPIVATLRVFDARTPMEMLAALPTALAVLALHYAWAVSSKVSFEEAEADAAERQARWREGNRPKSSPARGPRRPLFNLAPSGPAWVAIPWKNVIAGQRTPSRTRPVVLLASSLTMPVVMLANSGLLSGKLMPALAGIAGILALVVAIAGPQALRSDFRVDLTKIELLRSYPLPARQVVLGQLAAPFVVLAVLEWLLIALGTLLAFAVSPGSHLVLRASGAFASALVLPAVTLCGLVMHNGAVLLFPKWVGSATEQDGMAMFGQRLFATLATLFVLVFALVPAALVGSIVGVLAWRVFGAASVALAGMAAAGVVIALSYLSLGTLAQAFERFDPCSS